MNLKKLSSYLHRLTSALTSFLTNPKVILYLTITIFLGKTVYFFATHPQIQLIEDFPAHVARAYHTNLPWIGGWDTTYWTGYPLLLYPPLSHLILKTFLHFIGSQFLSVSLFVFICFLLTLDSLYRFIKSRISSFTLRTWVFLLTVVTFVFLPRTILGTFLGTLEVGGISAALALPLFFYYLASDSWITQGLFLGLIILTHTFTAVAAGVVFAARVFSRSFNAVYRLSRHQTIKPDFIFIKTQIYSLLLATIIGLPWIMPFLDPAFQSIAINLTIGFNATFFLSIFFLTSLLLIARQTHQLTKPLVLASVFFALLAVSFFIPQRQLEVFGIHGLHFYRFYLFFFILTPTTIAIMLTPPSKHIPIKINLSPTTQSLIVVLISSSLIWAPFTRLPASLNLDFSSIQSLSGRTINTINAPDLGPFPHAMQHLTAENSPLTSIVGYFYESSPLSFLYKTITATINPNSFNMGRVSDYYGSPLNSPQKTKQAIDLMGINYLITSSNIYTPIKDQPHYVIGTFIDHRNSLESYYYLTPISSASAATTLNYLPSTDPHLDLAAWWRDTDHTQLVTREKYQVPDSINTATVSATVSHLTPTSMTITIDSNQPTPTLIKYTYSPYWQAEVANSTSFTTQPVWITPGYIFLTGSGEINLTWRTPAYMKTFAPLGFITAILTTLYLLLVRFHLLPPPSSKHSG